MQDEITKHSRKIFKSLRNGNSHTSEKIREVLVEICIIVFAVSISIWLHEWSAHRHQQKEAKEFLADLKEDLVDDVRNMQASHDSLASDLTKLKYLYRITTRNVDSIMLATGAINFHSNVGTTKLNTANYEGFKFSGKIEYLEDRGLKKKILKYYSDATPSLNEAERINASQLLDISRYMVDNAERDLKQNITNAKFKRLLEGFAGTANSTLQLYKDAIDLANQIIAEVDE